MAATLVLTITAEDIAQGKRQDNQSCPIALSIKRRFPGSIVRHGARYGHIDHQFNYDGGKKARDFVVAFDAGRTVKPCTIPVVIR